MYTLHLNAMILKEDYLAYKNITKYTYFMIIYFLIFLLELFI